jgi:hypothetical protein
LNKLYLTIVAVAVLAWAAQPESSYAQSSEKAVALIIDAAHQLCTTPPMQQNDQSLKWSAGASAKLSGVIRKLADLGIEGAFEYKSEKSQGVLQKDLATAIKDGNDCGLSVLTVLSQRLIPQVQVPIHHESRTFHLYQGVTRAEDAYPIVGTDNGKKILISDVTFVLEEFSDRYTYSLDLAFYTLWWAPGRGANLYVDLMNDQGGAIPGKQLLQVVDDGHCTRAPGAEHAHYHGTLTEYPPDLLKTISNIRLRSDRLDYKMGRC